MNKLRVLSVLVILAITLVTAGCGGGGGARSVEIDKDVVGITSTLNSFIAAARSGDQAALQSLLASPGESYLIVKDFGVDITDPDDNQSYEFYVNPDLIAQISTDRAYVYAYYILHSGDPLWLYFDMVREDGRWVIEEMKEKAPEAGGYVQPIEPTPITPVTPSEFVAASYNPIDSDIVKIFSVEDSRGNVIPTRLILNYGSGYLDSISGVTLHQLNEMYVTPSDPSYEGNFPSAASRKSLVGSIAGKISNSVRTSIRSGRFSLRGQSEPDFAVYYGFDSQGAFYVKMEDSTATAEFNNGQPIKLFEPSHPFGTVRSVTYPYVVGGVTYSSTITLEIGFSKTIETPLQSYTVVPILITDVDDDTGEGEKWVEYLAAGIGEVGYDSFESLTAAEPVEIERLLTRFNSSGSLKERNDPVITNTNTYLGSYSPGDTIVSTQITMSGGTAPLSVGWVFGTPGLEGISVSPSGLISGFIAGDPAAGDGYLLEFEVVDKYGRHGGKAFTIDITSIGSTIDSVLFGDLAVTPETYDLYASLIVDPNIIDQNFTLSSDGAGPTLIFQTPPSGPFLPSDEVEVFPDALDGTWHWNSSWSPAYPTGGPVDKPSYIILVGDYAEFYLENTARTKFVYIKVQVVDVNAVAPADRTVGDLRLDVINYDASSSDYFAVSVRK